MFAGLLGRAFTVGGLLRSGWFVVGLVGVLGGISGGSYYLGHKHADNACELGIEKARNDALEEVSAANTRIADVRVNSEKRRAENGQIFDELRGQISEAEFLDEVIFANGCELDPDRLRLINAAISRANGSHK